MEITQEKTRSFRRARLLLALYLGLSVATVLALVPLSHRAGMVNPAVWVRGTIVAASAALMIVFAARAARGSRRALLRLRIISAIVLVAIVVIVALPGTFPVWFKSEQATCGLLLAGVVALINSRAVRTSDREPAGSR
jgi:O-antigen/teichoic acid export membrane protein